MDAAARPPRTTGAALTTADQLAADIAHMGPREAARTLEQYEDDLVLEVLQRASQAVVSDVIAELDDQRKGRLFAAGPREITNQWSVNQAFPDGSVGRLMEAPNAVFRPHQTVAEVSQRIREIVRRVLVTYAFVTEQNGRLAGIVTMRDLLVSDPATTLSDIMLRDPFTLHPAMPLMDAMKQVLNRHFPVYPVCDDSGRLIGLVRGQAMFEEQAFEISAQPGRMVGVDKEERLLTPWPRSLRFRHPWLQLNLLTAFVAAGVVGFFQHTLNQLVILAIFLPVLAGQSGNTGCQALAVTLRGVTLGELKAGMERTLVAKEALLGILNGALVGITAGAGMYIVARLQSNPLAGMLAFIVAIAMLGSCLVSGVAGAVIPLALKRLGADPATASSIFLTTATDVASMGMLLGFATLLLM